MTTRITYQASGSVRGDCGHAHKTPETAARCAVKDQRDCAKIGGGAYSDRWTVLGSDGSTTPVDVALGEASEEDYGDPVSDDAAAEFSGR